MNYCGNLGVAIELKDILPSKFYEFIETGGIGMIKEILTLSLWDIRKLTGLCNDDITLIKNIVSSQISPQVVTATELKSSEDLECVQTGCEAIDNLLKGGFRKGTITEIYGESGAGKTQITIQTAVNNWKNGCIFICTEDMFPVKRFEQMKNNLPQKDIDYGKNVFIEHITEANDLLACVKLRLPLLLQKIKVALIVIDSVAAPYRSESTNYVERAEELRDLAVSLIEIAKRYKIAVLCLNQVTSLIDSNRDLSAIYQYLNNKKIEKVLPSLGLAWSNVVSNRLWLKKTNVHYKDYTVRELEVVFSSYLPNAVSRFIITPVSLTTV